MPTELESKLLKLPPSWWELIDRDRGDQEYTAWLRDAIKLKLGRKRMPDEVRRGRPETKHQ